MPSFHTKTWGPADPTGFCPSRLNRLLRPGTWSICLSPGAPVLDTLSPFREGFRPEPSLVASSITPAHLAGDGGGMMDVGGIRYETAPDTSQG